MDLKTLTEINAPSGHEQAIRRFLLDELKKLGFAPVLDRMGNVVVVKEGTGDAPRKRVMVSAHMDEVGLIVTSASIAQAFNRRDLSGCDEIQMNNEKIYGKISGESVYVYPPGIPILCPGEVITRKIIAILQAAGEAGLEVVGVKEGALLCLR